MFKELNFLVNLKFCLCHILYQYPKKSLFKEWNTTAMPSIFSDYESLSGSCNSLETILATLNFI